MSFDIGVWSSRKRISDRQARRIYVRLCEKGETSRIDPQPDARERLSSFLQELQQKYPPISSDAWTGETINDCPWSCNFDVSDMHAIMSSVWSRADEIAYFVEELAYMHELVCYNPQSDTVQLPASLGGIRRKRAAADRPPEYAEVRAAKKANLRAVGDALDRALGALGFEKRDVCVSGYTLECYTLEINPETLGVVCCWDSGGSGDLVPRITVRVGIRNRRLEEALAEQRGEIFHPYWPPSINLGIGTLMGRTERVWSFKSRDRDEEKAERIAAAVNEYGIPFMEAHASLAMLVDKIGQPYFYWTEPEEQRAAVAQRLLAGE